MPPLFNLVGLVESRALLIQYT